MTNILIIDGNNWFRRKAEIDLHGNPMRTCFYELQNNTTHDLIFLVWDGYKSLSKRREIYPEYKMKRYPPSEGFFDIQKEFKELAKLSKVITVEMQGYEGDDVIAHLVKRFIPQVGADSILIESNDGDFGQLGVPITTPTAKVEAGYVVPFKCVVGDPSDNIKGIPGFGKGAWDKLDVMDIEHIKKWLAYEDPKYLEHIEFTKRVQNWIDDESNHQQIYNYRDIVNFLEIDEEEIDKNLIHGKDRPDLAEQTLKKYFS